MSTMNGSTPQGLRRMKWRSDSWCPSGPRWPVVDEGAQLAMISYFLNARSGKAS